MKRTDLVLRVRSLTRDLSNAIFREIDIIDYLNEGVNRIKQVVPEMKGLVDLTSSSDEPTLLPVHYHHLLALYSASRCFGQDERHYQASTYMNEFEQKLDEMKASIENGQTVIIDPITKLPVDVGSLGIDFVKTKNYFETKTGIIDVDKGVEGVPS